MLKRIKRGHAREIIIYLALIFELSYEITQWLLGKFEEPELYARNRRDTIIIWALYHKNSTKVVNSLCEKYGCPKVGEFADLESREVLRFMNKLRVICNDL